LAFSGCKAREDERVDGGGGEEKKPRTGDEEKLGRVN